MESSNFATEHEQGLPLLKKLFLRAGVKINGRRSFDLRVLNSKFYDAILKRGGLGLGEAYVAGWFACERVDEMIYRVLKHKIFADYDYSKLKKKEYKKLLVENEVYFEMFGAYREWSSGNFEKTADLNTAEEEKLALLCKKLKLQKSDCVLDIGCGYGGFAKYAAEKYACRVTGISLNPVHIKYAEQFTADLPVRIIWSDFRNIEGIFDKVLLSEAIEEIGCDNHRELFKIISEHITKNGLVAIETMGRDAKLPVDPWINNYLFTNEMLPIKKDLESSLGEWFKVKEWRTAEKDFDKTYLAWWRNFKKVWPRMRKKYKYSPEVYRFFNYYLLSVAGAFRAKNLQAWKITLSPKDLSGKRN